MEPTFRLRTFGGITLLVDGAAVTGALTQRRQLALLALLAVARDQGMSRDKILGCLWPEKDAESARHTLNQQLYAQRQTGSPGLFTGRKTLRLNPALFQSDLWTFEDALREGRWEGAVETYRGTFLDGFFLRESSEFEEWVEGQRRRLARLHTEALEHLCRAAEEVGDAEGLVRWRRRAAEVDPLDGHAALGLARALIQRGDRPGAIRELRDYEDRLRKRLEVEPDPEIRRLLADLAS